MKRKQTRTNPENTSRRKFLQTVGVSVPTLTVFTHGDTDVAGEEPKGPDDAASSRFIPIELSGVLQLFAYRLWATRSRQGDGCSAVFKDERQDGRGRADSNSCGKTGISGNSVFVGARWHFVKALVGS